MTLPAVYTTLVVAVVAEVIGTSALAQSQGMTRPHLVAITFAGYGFALWCVGLALQVLPTGVVYALWSGLGIVLIVLISWLWGGQRPDFPALVGMGLILSGVVVIHLFSGATAR